MVEESQREVKFIKDLLFMTRCTVKGFSSGQMAESTTATSIRERKVARGFIFGQMVKFTTVNSKKITVLASAFSTIQMEKGLKDYGEMERNMAKASTFGRLALSTTVSTWMAIRKIKDSLTMPLSLSMSSSKATATLKSVLRWRRKLNILSLIHI